MSADISRLKLPGVDIALKRKSRNYVTIYCKSNSRCLSRWAIHSIYNVSRIILLGSKLLLYASNHRNVTCLVVPNDILHNVVRFDNTVVDVSSHINFNKMRSMCLSREVICHRDTRRSCFNSAYFLAINLEMNCLRDCAIRRIIKRNFTKLVGKRIVERRLKPNVNFLHSPVLSYQAASIIGNTKVYLLCTNRKIICDIKRVLPSNGSVSCNNPTAYTPCGCAICNLVARRVNAREVIFDYSFIIRRDDNR